MADIKDKEYSQLKEDIEMLGKGAEIHKADKVHPLPPNIIKKRYADAESTLKDAFDKFKDAETQMKIASKSYQQVFKDSEGLKNTDSRLIKGIFGIYNPELRDFGIQPQKKSSGRKPKP